MATYPDPRVAIVTLTQSENYGTVLQAYATRRLFAAASPFAFDLVPTDVRRVRWRRVASMARSFTDLDRIANFRSMRRFIAPEIRASRRYVDITDRMAATAYLQEHFDAYITGSDEIWNLANVGPDSIYFLPPELTGYRASFGTSANRLDRNTLSAATLDRLAASLARYDHITVRDTNTADMVADLLGDDHRPAEIIDPTLIYEFPESTPAARPESGRLRVLIMLHDHAVAEALVAHIGRRADLDSVFIRHSGARLLRLTPLEFTTVFGAYHCVVTDFFHGACMSIRTGVPFLSIDRERLYGDCQSKIANITSKLDLTGSYLNLVGMPGKVAAQQVVDFVDGVLNGDITRVNSRLALEREREYAQSVIATVVEGIAQRRG